MGSIEIRKVTTRLDLKEFINFQFTLYKGNRFWCPPLKFDEVNTLRRDKNPAFDYCESEYWLAYKEGKIAGRIAGIINHNEIKRWNVRLARFGWIDFIDDPGVSAKLIETGVEWGRSKGMEGLHGPFGFTDMDAEGMLTEGFEEISGLSAIYNYPYYNAHMERLGFQKSVDWVQLEIKVPDEVPAKVARMTNIVLEKYDLHLLKVKNTRELLPYAGKMFRLYNHAFHDIYGFTALTEKQIDYYSKLWLSFVRPQYLSLVIDAKDDVVGFGVSIPSLSIALQKANGTLFPLGFYHLMRAMKKNDTVYMYLVGVHPDYQGKGVLALVYSELTRSYINAGMKIARTHPQLEENHRAISIWKNYESRVYIRRRCWILNF